MKELIHEIKTLKKTDISQTIKKKLNTFNLLKKEHPQTIFQGLCYCILTANCPAKRCIKIQHKLSGEFLTASISNLSKKLKKYGY